MKKNTETQIETKHSSHVITTQDRKLYDIPVEGSYVYCLNHDLSN